MNVQRLLIGGTRSGEGKTTIALGLMAALRQRGMPVQGFKVGPDYLDTGYQLLATGRRAQSRSVDDGRRSSPCQPRPGWQQRRHFDHRRRDGII